MKNYLKTKGILFSVFYIMFREKMQGISSKLFVLGRKFSNFVPRASSTLRNFPVFFALKIWQLSDGLRKSLKFHINVQQGFKRLLNGLLDLPFYWVIITYIFRSSIASVLAWVWLLHLKQIRSSKDDAAPFSEKWEVYKLIRIVSLS